MYYTISCNYKVLNLDRTVSADRCPMFNLGATALTVDNYLEQWRLGNALGVVPISEYFIAVYLQMLTRKKDKFTQFKLKMLH